jgi:hypothetical protein
LHTGWNDEGADASLPEGFLASSRSIADGADLRSLQQATAHPRVQCYLHPPTIMILFDSSPKTFQIEAVIPT